MISSVELEDKETLSDIAGEAATARTVPGGGVFVAFRACCNVILLSLPEIKVEIDGGNKVEMFDCPGAGELLSRICFVDNVRGSVCNDDNA